MNIYLIGFMGVGKSTLALELGKRLELPVHDLDREIENLSARAVTDIIREHGETAFRELERDTLGFLLKKYTGVVACGGGTPCFYDNLTRMRQAGVVVYLQMRSDRLAQRLDGQTLKRPLLQVASGDRLAWKVERMLDLREPHYRQAHIIWSASVWDVGGLCRQLLAYSK